VIGKTVAHYQILEKLGEGGMGVVYKARDTHLDRVVALKVLQPEKVADSERKRRFVQEAKAASALNHPNITTIHDIASEKHADFIVMEYVQGKTLDALVPRKGLRLNETLKLAHPDGRCAGQSPRSSFSSLSLSTLSRAIVITSCVKFA
jgi:eukaryotic-like serine/threonine-protein kinase